MFEAVADQGPAGVLTAMTCVLAKLPAELWRTENDGFAAIAEAIDALAVQVDCARVGLVAEAQSRGVVSASHCPSAADWLMAHCFHLEPADATRTAQLARAAGAGQPGPGRRSGRRNPHGAQSRHRATPARPGRTRPGPRQPRRSVGLAHPDRPKRVQRQRGRRRTDPDVPGRGRAIPRPRRNRPTRPLLPSAVPDGQRDAPGQQPARPRSRRRPQGRPGPPDRTTPRHAQPGRQTLHRHQPRPHRQRQQRQRQQRRQVIEL
jgi:hypothetical protein